MLDLTKIKFDICKVEETRTLIISDPNGGAYQLANYLIFQFFLKQKTQSKLIDWVSIFSKK